MPTAQELEAKLWSELKSDMTVMLGLDGIPEAHPRPMTAQIEQARGPLWFFTAKHNDIVRNLSRSNRALVTFASKGHGLFATMHGTLTLSNDRAAIDRLWNSFVAAWYEGGKSDPQLALLRLEAEHAEIWENASSIAAGIKLLLGVDPKKEYRDKVAEVSLR